jgi:hypothetical protein
MDKYIKLALKSKDSILKEAKLRCLASIFNTPRGIRIPVTSVKGKCPRPLDDGGISNYDHIVVLETAIVNTFFYFCLLLILTLGYS